MRVTNKSWICLVMAFLPFFAWAGIGEITSSVSEMIDTRFEQSQIHAQNILKKYPPSQFVIWGLGRTTGLVAERLRQLSGKEDYVIEVPVENIAEIIKMSSDQQNLFFERVLPPSDALQGRHLVLFRVLWHSLSMTLISESLINHLVSKQYPLPLYTYLISDQKANKLPLFQYPERKPYLKNMAAYVVVDSSFQSKYRDELNVDTYIKGMTRLGKYLHVNPRDIISPEFSFHLNPFYEQLALLIQTDLENRKQGINTCVRIFSEFRDRVFLATENSLEFF